MITNVYKQGDIILIRYPLSDKPEKSIIRPVVVVSNGFSNNQDKDVLVCQITTKLRNNIYSYALTDDKLTVAMPEPCEGAVIKSLQLGFGIKLFWIKLVK